MKNTIKIFLADLKGLTTNFFALVIAIALCFLPALYAWFNIYANWDPYANTGNIMIAVCSEDEGWTNSQKEELNMGESIKEELAQKDSIHWVFLDTSREAVEGVRSGEYYAAIVIDKDFTYSMYNALSDNFSNPKITYYENQKKNAVATKITDSAVSTLQSSINEQYIKAVTETVFETTNGVSKELSDSTAVDDFIGKLREVSANIKAYSEMLDTFMDGNKKVSITSEDTVDSLAKSQNDIDKAVNNLNRAEDDLTSTQDSYNTYSVEVNNTLSTINQSLGNISKELAESGLESDIVVLCEDMKKIGTDSGLLAEQLGELEQKAEQLNTGGMQSQTLGQIKAAKQMAQSIQETTVAMDSEDTAKKSIDYLQSSLQTYSTTLVQIQDMYNNQICPQINAMLDSMEETLESVEKLLGTLSETMYSMSDIFGSVDTTMGTLNMSLKELKKVIDSTSRKLDETLNKLDNASEEEQLEIAMELLSGDPETYSDFFSQPVVVEENYIYEIMNYGSGVAPFYTTLAIWVGMTILVSMIKVHANTDGIENPKPAELFLGRYLLFFCLSQLQAFIIVLGDLYLLKIQCLYPAQLFLTASVAALAFSLLIYALTISFGDIGKALAVVIMVIQIAGSGGTYPIDALPGFFRAVYVFFPFPYAIDAMRECIGGMYGNAFTIYILELLVFVVAALLIGLVIRIPFVAINHFIEERMEDTKML